MKSLSWVMLCVTLASACATVRPLTESPPLAQRHADAIDWPRAKREAVDLLRGYLQVESVNPPGRETEAAQFLATQLALDGITSQLVEFAPGRHSLIARLPASGAALDKPLCLLSHLDVVTAEAEKWHHGPFSGDLADGFIWGRGALDMKGMGALEVMTMRLLARSKVALRRDVILLAVGDEEVSNQGMQHLVSHEWASLDCGVLINEGGLGLKDLFAQGETVYPITVAEKGVLWATLIAEGEAGHGSTPMPTRAPSRLARALELVTHRSAPVVIHPSMYELLERLGARHGGVERFVLAHPLLVDAFATGRLVAQPPTHAAVTNTCQVTGFSGQGSAPNVVPSRATATLDCRVLPGTTPEQLLRELKALVASVEGVSVEPIAMRPASVSTWSDPFFDALERHLRRERPDVVVGPALSPGFTDSNFARPLGTIAYGLVPFEVDGELLATIHGADERVPVTEVERGLEILFRSVLDVVLRQ